MLTGKNISTKSKTVIQLNYHLFFQDIEILSNNMN